MIIGRDPCGCGKSSQPLCRSRPHAWRHDHREGSGSIVATISIMKAFTKIAVITISSVIAIAAGGCTTGTRGSADDDTTTSSTGTTTTPASATSSTGVPTGPAAGPTGAGSASPGG